MTARDAAAGGALPRKTFECDIKTIGEDGTFALYAAIFGNVDRQGDVIEPGAFDNLEEFTRDGWIALNHRADDAPIGYITEATQDGKGLLVKGRFHTTPSAQEVRTVVRERKAAGKRVLCSIGYVTRSESFKKVDGQNVRSIERLSAYEASIVNLPANPAADVVDAKAAEILNDEGDDDVKDRDKGSIVDALKTIFDLDFKADGDVPASHHTRLKAFAQAMHEHGQKSKELARGFHEHGKAACAMAKEMHAALKAYKDMADGGDDLETEGEGDMDGEEVTVEKPKKPAKGKSRKEDEPEDTADGNPPKGRKSVEAVYREQLRARALKGRALADRP